MSQKYQENFMQFSQVFTVACAIFNANCIIFSYCI